MVIKDTLKTYAFLLFFIYPFPARTRVRARAHVKFSQKKYLKKIYNFFTMFFFGKNLTAKHKATLCLVALGILANCWLCSKAFATSFPFVEFVDSDIIFHMAESMPLIILAYGIFIKMLVIRIFRKF